MESSILTLSGIETKAWIYNGKWVADCPRKGCGNVELATFNFTCSNCSMKAITVFPQCADAMMEILNARPIPQTRNWFYPGQQLALKANQPHGQSVDELIEENREHGVF